MGDCHFLFSPPSEKEHNLPVYEQHVLETKTDSGLISGFLDAIRSFGIELVDEDVETQSIKLEYKQLKILMSEHKDFRIILILSESPSKDLLESVKELLKQIEEKYLNLLKKFDGDIKPFRGMEDLVEEELSRMRG